MLNPVFESPSNLSLQTIGLFVPLSDEQRHFDDQNGE
jgi:hypothetical protein